MTYFARLREQSGLIVSPARTMREVEPPLEAAAPNVASDIIEMAEQRDAVADPGVRIAERLSPVSVPDTSSSAAETMRASESEPVTDVVRLDSVTGTPQARQAQGAEHPATPPVRSESGADPTPIEDVETISLSREQTLRHVFDWLAAPAQSLETPEERARASHDEPAPATSPVAARAASQAWTGSPAAEPPVRMLAQRPVAHEEHPRIPMDEETPAAAVSPDHRTELDAAAARSRPAADTDDVEEILTVSIGAIHLNIDASTPAPMAAARPAAPARPDHPERRPASRLSRHYLRP